MPDSGQVKLGGTAMSKAPLSEQLQKRILVMDGAMGTMLQQANLTAEDFGGEQYEGCNEYLNITAPDTIAKIHREYLEAGADIIETNTFGATSIVLDDYDLGFKAYELNKIAGSNCQKRSRKNFYSGMAPVCCRFNGTDYKNLKCYRWNYV